GRGMVSHRCNWLTTVSLATRKVSRGRCGPSEGRTGVSGQDLLWGIALVGAGVFVAVYGTSLFQFALGAMGFGIGFLLAMQILEGQSESVRILVAFIAGFVVAFACYAQIGRAHV